MDDYYKILDVPENATQSQIKHAFRQKAKSLHPDTSGADGEQVRRLLQAYKTLSAIDARSKFDSVFKKYETVARSSSDDVFFDYVLWLSKRQDSDSRTKLIFFFLLHDKETEAVTEYLSLLKKTPSYVLEKYLEREDFMDIGFILAEELYFRQHYYEACCILNRIFVLEQERPYFKFFFPEVQTLFWDIIKNKLLGSISDELALDCWEDALELGLDKKCDSIIFGKMAEAFNRIGDIDSARACLKEALTLDSSVKGVSRLRNKLGVL